MIEEIEEVKREAVFKEVRLSANGSRVVSNEVVPCFKLVLCLFRATAERSFWETVGLGTVQAKCAVASPS